MIRTSRPIICKSRPRKVARGSPFDPHLLPSHFLLANGESTKVITSLKGSRKKRQMSRRRGETQSGNGSPNAQVLMVPAIGRSANSGKGIHSSKVERPLGNTGKKVTLLISILFIPILIFITSTNLGIREKLQEFKLSLLLLFIYPIFSDETQLCVCPSFGPSVDLSVSNGIP